MRAPVQNGGDGDRFAAVGGTTIVSADLRPTTVFLMATVPPEMASAVTDHLRDFANSFPRWIRSLYVNASHTASVDGDGVNASITTAVEYGNATLWLFPVFLHRTREEQRATIAHEIAHLHGAPFHDFTERVVGKFVADESVRKFVSGEGVQHLEAATQDLADVLVALATLAAQARAASDPGSA